MKINAASLFYMQLKRIRESVARTRDCSINITLLFRRVRNIFVFSKISFRKEMALGVMIYKSPKEFVMYTNSPWLGQHESSLSSMHTWCSSCSLVWWWNQRLQLMRATGGNRECPANSQQSTRPRTSIILPRNQQFRDNAKMEALGQWNTFLLVSMVQWWQHGNVIVATNILRISYRW